MIPLGIIIWATDKVLKSFGPDSVYQGCFRHQFKVLNKHNVAFHFSDVHFQGGGRQSAASRKL